MSLVETESRERLLPPYEKVAILDAGAQYGKVIDRKVRELSLEKDLDDTSFDAILTTVIQ